MPVEKIRELYEQHRFMDAYALTKGLWSRTELVDELGAAELVLACRLAHRLGNPVLARRLYAVAASRFPEHEAVVYFGRYFGRPRGTYLELLKKIDGASYDWMTPGYRASALASDARLWATVRDMKRAYRLLDEADAVGMEEAWRTACRSLVLTFDDKWTEARAAAEKAWSMSPGMPVGGHVLGQALEKTGELEKAAQVLYDSARERQCYEIVVMALFYLGAMVERTTGDVQGTWTNRTHEVADSLAELVPLANRTTRKNITKWKLSVAFTEGSYEDLAEIDGDERPTSFFHKVREHVAGNPDGTRVILPHEPVRQKFNTCLPSSMAAIIGGWGIDVDEDRLAAKMTYGGTQSDVAADWLKSKGYHVRHITVTPELARDLIDNEMPFVLVLETESTSHAVAVIGTDTAAGTLILHDPSFPRMGHYLLDDLVEKGQPLGPEGLVFVRPDDEEKLACIPESAHEPMSLSIRYGAETRTSGYTAASRVLDEFSEKYPDHPIERFCTAQHLSGTGRTTEALDILEKLAEGNPRCIRATRSMMTTIAESDDVARLREALEEAVTRRALPGINMRGTWQHPPTYYVCRYADLLKLSADTLPRAKQLIARALRCSPYDGFAYHVCGDIHQDADEHEESLLPLKIGALLTEEDDHSARAFCDAARLAGREEEGLEFLRSRAERMSDLVRGRAAWGAVAQAYFDYGYPGRALKVLEKITAADSPPELLFYAARVWVELSDWDKAEQCVSMLEEKGAEALKLFLAAKCTVLERRGRWREALPVAGRWVEEIPQSMEARDTYIRLFAKDKGQQAAVELARRWIAERPGHERLEQCLVERLDLVGDSEGAKALLEDRLRRNRHDAWAWRELGHRLLGVYQQSSASSRKALAADLDKAIDEAVRTGPDNCATVALLAGRKEADGQAAEAVDLYLRAVKLEPSYDFGYGRACRHLPGLPREEQDRVLGELNQCILRCVGQLHGARALAFEIADLRGPAEAEKLVLSWKETRKRDPELAEAHADILLEYRQSREDAEKASRLLEEAIKQFPWHMGLLRSKARLHSVMLDEEAEIGAAREIMRREPTDVTARIALAHVLGRRKKLDEARALLEEATRVSPLSVEAWNGLARHEWENNRPLEALDLLRRGLELMPHRTALRDHLIERLFEMGDSAEAIEHAREGVRLRPDEAYAWYLLGSALSRGERHTDFVETEQAYRKALECDRGFYGAADDLACLLVQRQRYADARKLLDEQIADQPDDSRPRGRLAWTIRMEGRKADAIDAMHAALRDYPRYGWGWACLMEWLEEDENWDKVKEILATWPESARDMPQLRAHRLELLGRADEDAAKLDAEWDKLLDDFPQDRNIHLRRHDILWDQERKSDARAVLDNCLRLHGDSSYVLQREAVHLGDKGEKEKTLEVVRKIWIRPHGTESWPDLAACDVLRDHNWTAAGVQLCRSLIEDSYRIGLGAFSRMVRFDLQTNAYRAGSMLKLLKNVPWDAAEYVACVLSTLGDLGHGKAALSYWRANREAWQIETAIWQQVGHILLDQSRRRARAFLADWRNQKGVDMFIVCNYTMALRGSEVEGHLGDRLEEIHTNSCDALERLEHDWTARYLVLNMCEAALRLGRYDVFLAHMDEYRAYVELEPDDSRHYMSATYGYMPGILLVFDKLLRLEKPGKGQLAGLEEEMAKQALRSNVPKWVVADWFACLERVSPGAATFGKRLRWRARRFFAFLF